MQALARAARRGLAAPAGPRAEGRAGAAMTMMRMTAQDAQPQPQQLLPLQQQVRGFALAGKVKRRERVRAKREGRVLGDFTGVPTVSHDPEIFEVQKELFGYNDPYSGANKAKKEVRWEKRLIAHRAWYPPTVEEFKQSIRFDLKRQRYRLRQEGGHEEELKDIAKLLEVFRWTPEQIQRRHKLTILKRRGKGPPKKGQGKRS